MLVASSFGIKTTRKLITDEFLTSSFPDVIDVIYCLPPEQVFPVFGVGIKMSCSIMAYLTASFIHATPDKADLDSAKRLGLTMFGNSKEKQKEMLNKEWGFMENPKAPYVEVDKKEVVSNETQKMHCLPKG